MGTEAQKKSNMVKDRASAQQANYMTMFIVVLVGLIMLFVFLDKDASEHISSQVRKLRETDADKTQAAGATEVPAVTTTEPVASSPPADCTHIHQYLSEESEAFGMHILCFRDAPIDNTLAVVAYMNGRKNMRKEVMMEFENSADIGDFRKFRSELQKQVHNNFWLILCCDAHVVIFGTITIFAAGLHQGYW
jgi:hypothetical protein